MEFSLVENPCGEIFCDNMTSKISYGDVAIGTGTMDTSNTWASGTGTISTNPSWIHNGYSDHTHTIRYEADSYNNLSLSYGSVEEPEDNGIPDMQEPVQVRKITSNKRIKL